MPKFTCCICTSPIKNYPFWYHHIKKFLICKHCVKDLYPDEMAESLGWTARDASWYMSKKHKKKITLHRPELTLKEVLNIYKVKTAKVVEYLGYKRKSG